MFNIVSYKTPSITACKIDVSDDKKLMHLHVYKRSCKKDELRTRVITMITKTIEELQKLEDDKIMSQVVTDILRKHADNIDYVVFLCNNFPPFCDRSAIIFFLKNLIRN